MKKTTDEKTLKSSTLQNQTNDFRDHVTKDILELEIGETFINGKFKEGDNGCVKTGQQYFATTKQGTSNMYAGTINCCYESLCQDYGYTGIVETQVRLYPWKDESGEVWWIKGSWLHIGTVIDTEHETCTLTEPDGWVHDILLVRTDLLYNDKDLDEHKGELKTRR